MIKIIAIFIIITSIALLFFEQQKVVSKPAERPSVDAAEEINKYMQEIEFQKKAQEIKLKRDLEGPEVRGSSANASDGNIDDDIASQDFSDTQENAGEIGKHEIITESEYINEEQWQKGLNQAEGSDAYVQQFIENARKDGYIIRVDKNHQIIDIKKIGE